MIAAAADLRAGKPVSASFGRQQHVHAGGGSARGHVEDAPAITFEVTHRAVDLRDGNPDSRPHELRPGTRSLVSENYRTRLVADLQDIGCARWDALLAGDPTPTPFCALISCRHCNASGAAKRCDRLDAALSERSGKAKALAGAVRCTRKRTPTANTFSIGPGPRLTSAMASCTTRSGWRRCRSRRSKVSRLIAGDPRARERLADELLAHARASGDSSLHVLLAPAAQIELLARRGMLVRSGLQFHWRNAGYTSFDEFLATLRSRSARKIRAERRKVVDAGVVLERRVGAAITEHDWSFSFAATRPPMRRIFLPPI